MAKMYECPECGEKLEEHFRVCPVCGYTGIEAYIRKEKEKEEKVRQAEEEEAARQAEEEAARQAEEAARQAEEAVRQAEIRRAEENARAKKAKQPEIMNGEHERIVSPDTLLALGCGFFILLGLCILVWSVFVRWKTQIITAMVVIFLIAALIYHGWKRWLAAAIALVMIWVFFLRGYVNNFVTPIITPTTETGSTVIDTIETEEVTADSDIPTIVLYCGERAPITDFIFPYSSSALLTWDDLNSMYDSSPKTRKMNCQMAINEIFARYGFSFRKNTETAEAARTKFEEKEWYRKAQAECPTNDQDILREKYFNKYENDNIDKLLQWEAEYVPQDM